MNARHAILAATLAGLTALAACSGVDEAAQSEARELCHQRVADRAWVADIVEFIRTDSLEPVDDTYFFHGVADFPTARDGTVRHTFHCKVTPGRAGGIWNETTVTPQPR